MHQISSSELVRLVNEGFVGEVLFEGRVFAGIIGTYAMEANGHFYEARGSFKLSAPVSGSEGYCLEALTDKKDTSNNFRLK